MLRLLGIRWAELDGQAALEWAHSRFHKTEPGAWDRWLDDLVSAWSATQPDAASDWLGKVLRSDELKESWGTSGGHLPFEKWARPGNVLALARAQIASMKGVSLSFSRSSLDTAFSRQIITLSEVQALRALVEETGARWPERVRPLRGGRRPCAV
ncbi:MAG: hypothetical protein V4726_08050 [Verrucomicrobiota bacterium]